MEKIGFEKVLRYGAVGVLFFWNIQLQSDVNDVKNRLYNCFEQRINDNKNENNNRTVLNSVAILTKNYNDENYQRYFKKRRKIQS